MATMKQTAIKGKTLIDGNGGAVVAEPVIVVDNGRIAAVGAKDAVGIPHGAEVVDASHCTLMPGMMDLHIHLSMFNNRTFKNYRVAQWEVTPHLQQMYAFFHAQLCFEMGFTTLRDLGMQSTRGLMSQEMCAVRDAINVGVLAGPRLFVAGFTYMTGSHLELIFPRAAERHGFQSGDGPWELRKLARLNLRHGVDVIKTCASGGGGTDKEEPDVPQSHPRGTRCDRRRGARAAQARRRPLLYAGGAPDGDQVRLRHDRAHGVPRRRFAGEDFAIANVDDADAGASHRSCDRDPPRDRHAGIHAEQDEDHSAALLCDVPALLQSRRQHRDGHRHGLRAGNGYKRLRTGNLCRPRDEADGRDFNGDAQRRKGAAQG